eukprot:COSAG01_NODE_5241_length_4389_cov_25.402470_1_plen_24_part_10
MEARATGTGIPARTAGCEACWHVT